jgi:hypothetical protein
MSTVQFRIDYAKFLISCPPDLWHHWYSELNRESHEFKAAGEWLKCHKVNRLWYNADAGMETWSIDIWGEWAGIVNQLPPEWIQFVKRLDVRAIVWDTDKDTVLNIGQHLQRHVTSHNVNVFSTKPATKRLGRDRGGVGFAIGSHKSDLRITCYKRTGEPVAQEFQCSGAMLARLVDTTRVLVGPNANVRSVWRQLRLLIEAEGNKRLMRVLESAGIGTYWPVVGSSMIPQLPPIQASILVELGDDMAGEDFEMGDDTP